MATARYGNATYSVELAQNAADREDVYSLRESEYKTAQSYLLANSQANVRFRAADAYDERSFIFACRALAEDGEILSSPLATCRFTVPLHGRYELDDLAGAWPRPPVPTHALVETSRVVVRRDVRATGLVEVMLLLAGSWVLRETTHRYNFAVCARPLERLYARLGMGLASNDEITLRGRPADRRYVVIYGDMLTSRPAVEARLRKRGWDMSDSERKMFSATSIRKAGT
jgi:hypothetical protein